MMAVRRTSTSKVTEAARALRVCGRDPLGAIGLLHLPILAGAVLALVTGSRKANLLAPALFITSLAVVMVIRFRSIG
jgi:hypothetical protein